MLGQILTLIFVFGIGGSLKSCSPGYIPRDDDPKPASQPTVTVVGQFTYQKLSLKLNTDGTPVSPATTTVAVLPVRALDVVAFDGTSNKEIQTRMTATNDDGTFSLSVPAGSTFTLGLRSSTKVLASRANIEVRDPFTDGLYTFVIVKSETQGPFTAPSSGQLSIDISTIRATPASSRSSAILSMLDSVLRATDHARQVSGTVPPVLTVYWNAASTDGSYYTSRGGPDGGAAIYIKGGDSVNDDTDEFDDYVLLHEYGHFFADAFSRDASLGGSHALDELIYASASYSEGLASFLAGVFEVQPFLVDSARISSGSPLWFSINLEGGRDFTAPRTQKDELTIAEVLWDLADGVEGRANTDNESVALSLAQVYGALVGLRGDTTAYPYPSIQDFLTALVASGAVTDATVNSLLVTPEYQRISFGSTLQSQDLFPTTIPVGTYNRADWCTTRIAVGDVHYSAADESNRLFKFTLSQQTAVTVTMALQGGVTGKNADGTNVDLLLLTCDNYLATDTGSSILTPLPRPEQATESCSGTLPSGTYIILVHGRPNLYSGVLTNASSKAVSYRLSLVSP